MKGELLVLNGKLAFFFRKNDVKTKADKEAIRKMIIHLFHTHSIWADYTIKDVDEILKDSKSAYIGLVMDDSQNPDLLVHNFSVRNYQIARLVHEKI